MLNLQCSEQQDSLHIEASGRLDALGAAVLEKAFTDANPTSRRFILLDCQRIVFISSAGIRAIIQLKKSCQLTKGEFFLIAPPENVKQVLSMSGLLNQLKISDSVDLAMQSLDNLRSEQEAVPHFSDTGCSADWQHLNAEPAAGILWQSADPPVLASLTELGISFGVACLAESREQALVFKGLACSLPGFFCFQVQQNENVLDYFIGNPDAPQAVYCHEVISLPALPIGHFALDVTAEQKTTTLVRNLCNHLAAQQALAPAFFHFIILLEDLTWIQGLYTSPDMQLDHPEIAALSFIGKSGEPEYISLKLSAPDYQVPGSFVFEDLLQIIHNSEIQPAKAHHIGAGHHHAWFFSAEDLQNAEEVRTRIEFEEKFEYPEEWELIIREIYKDSGRVVLKQLHGGFSAKTFEVTSYDFRQRRMLPTVLKLANVAIIQREEKGYKDYVLPFILNNSTTIMGSHYVGNWGGIRYNFLGINGPETRLKWLTHIYKERNTNDLIPLFDKIFKNVLKPWYGQPRLEPMKLWENHSPLEPFFPNIVNDAVKILGIDPDEEYLDCPWLSRKVLNPYWFLKHSWPERMKQSRLWYSAVCHGDLNMQNILLDERDNIYIIDFSETHARNVVSDFARLEPIFKIEMTRMDDEANLRNKLLLEEALVNIDKLTDKPAFCNSGDDPQVQKAWEMVLKVREYARMTMVFEEDPVPYWLAVLEWTLPYVSYFSVPVQAQWHATFSAGLILEKIRERNG